MVSVGTTRRLISSFIREIEILKVYRHATELSVLVYRMSQKPCDISYASTDFYKFFFDKDIKAPKIYVIICK